MENTIKSEGVTLSKKEAEEYCAYKRQKKISEIMLAMRRSESELTANESAIKLCEKAGRLRQAAVRMNPSELIQRGEIFKRSPLKIDCIVGGNGETFPKVKAYEAKCAIRAGAKEVTLVLNPSAIESCRYQEIRKEVRRVKRATRKIPLKVQVEKVYQNTTMLRLARICSQVGVSYFSVPYFSGCHLLKTELSGGCLLEVYDVQTLERFKEMAGVCIGRTVTNHAWDIYEGWIKEVEKIALGSPAGKTEKQADTQAKDSVKTPMLQTATKPNLPALPLSSPATQPLIAATVQSTKETREVQTTQPTRHSQTAQTSLSTQPPPATNPDMDYQCYIEDGKLKFS